MKFFKRILKIIGYVAAILLLFVVIIAGITQTHFFKERFRIILVSSISKNINGSLFIGTISGNFITNLTIDSLAIMSLTEQIFSSGKIIVEYDPFSLLKQKLLIKHCIINQPNFNFVRLHSGEWNFSKLFLHDADPSRATFDLQLIIKRLDITHSTFFVFDSTFINKHADIDTPQKVIDYHNLKIKDFNLVMSLDFKKKDLRAHIHSANLYTIDPNFSINQLVGTISINHTASRISNCRIQTPRSLIQFSASIDRVNLFEDINLIELHDKKTQLYLRAHHLDLNELKILLKPVSFLYGSASLEIDANGDFGDLNIKRLNVQTYSSSFKLAGKIKNLHEPENLKLDILVYESEFTPIDAVHLMPTMNIPKLEQVGNSKIFAHFIGSPLEFKSTATVLGTFGEITFDGSLNLSNEIPRYEISYTTNNFDLSLFTQKKFKNFSLSGSGELKGEGFSIDDMHGRLQCKIDSLNFNNIILRESQLFVNALPRQFDALSVIKIDNMNIYGTVRTDFPKSQPPKFGIDLACRSLDLSKLLNLKQYQTDLNFNITTTITGYSLNNLSASAELSFGPSKINKYELNEETIFIMIDQTQPEEKNISIQSQIADVELEGKFILTQTPIIIASQIENLLKKIIHHTSPIDSLRENPVSTKKIEIEENKADFDLSINIILKNLEAISAIEQSRPFNSRGKIGVNITGNNDLFSLSSQGTIDEFFLGTMRQGIFLHSSDFKFNLMTTPNTNALQNLDGALFISTKSGFWNEMNLEDLKLEVNCSKGNGFFLTQGIIDTLVNVKCDGKLRIEPLNYFFEIESLSTTINEIEWKNSKSISLNLNPEGFYIKDGLIYHQNESISLNGNIYKTGDLDLAGELKNITIKNVFEILHALTTKTNYTNFSGILNTTIHVTGSPSMPAIKLNLKGEKITYRNTMIGEVSLQGNYLNKNAAIDLNIIQSVLDSVPYLTISGIIPIDLGLSGVTERIPDLQQRLTIKSDGFELGILEPFLPGFENISGTVSCNISLTGTPKTPYSTGNISIQNGRVTFIPTNVTYQMSGMLISEGEKIILKDFSIWNLPSEYQDGKAYLYGNIIVRDYNIHTFDIIMKGQLQFLSNASRKSLPTMYGTLIGATTDEGIKIQGDLKQPFIAGSLLIRNANLIFPPTKDVAKSSTILTVPYILIDDTTKPKHQLSDFSRQFYEVGGSKSPLPLEKTSFYANSFIERIRYNLNIETQGPTNIQMIFTPATNEELYAELDGKVNAINLDGSSFLYGEISIQPQSYYNFIKRFEATGKLKFVGQWDNPELDILATYEGYSEQLPTETLESAQDKKSNDQKTTQKKVVVILTISGNRYRPKLEMGMKIQHEPGKELEDWTTYWKGSDVQADAISFILTGKFRDQLTSRDKENIVSSVGTAAGSTMFTSFTTAYLSGILTDFLRKEFPFIRSAEVSYQGGNLQEAADLRLSGEAFRGYWKFGGKIFTDIGNANVSYQLSLGDVFNATAVRNLFFEFERKVEGSESHQDQKKLTNTAKIYYRVSF